MLKIVRIGTRQTYEGGRWASVYCKIEIKEGRLSISGVVGPLPSGNAIGSSGQIIDTVAEYRGWKYAPTWDILMRHKLVAIWRKWHLNDMRAGTPVQMRYLEENPIPLGVDWYPAALAALTSAGLNPDPVTGQRFGAAWYKEDLPADVVAWLESLPDTDRTPAWC